MTRRRVLLLGAGFAFVATIAVIALAGYYSTLSLLVSSQLPLIFLPTLVPFLVVAAQRLTSKAALAVVAAPMALGWAAVIVIDSRPYTGGGASMAVLLGWAACAVSVLLAGVALIVAPIVAQRR